MTITSAMSEVSFRHQSPKDSADARTKPMTLASPTLKSIAEILLSLARDKASSRSAK